MSKPIKIIVKESIKELQLLQRKYGELIGKRLRILIECKRHEKEGISKRELVAITGINHNTITKWRNIYLKDGIAPFLEHGRVGFKKSIVTEKEHKKLSALLNDSKNGINGYTELLEWVKNELSKEMKYITLVKYVQRHFGAKLKVARKSHILKDEKAAEDFKKTSVRSV